MRLLLLLAASAVLVFGQSGNPPVILINGYQFPPCATASAEGTFGQLPQRLRDAGRTVIFFNNCSVAATPPATRPNIEELGNALAQQITAANAPEVDLIAHSMGGLIIRSYLSGKQSGGGFRPPTPTRVRKVVFIATPHFGPGFGQVLLNVGGSDPQVRQLVPGSPFMYELNTWNQFGDDLRGVDAISIAGNVANGGDGLVSVPSAAQPGNPDRTRVVPYCHTNEGTLALLASGCRNPPYIANVNSDDHLSWRIIRSFLSGTNDWQTLGTSLRDDQTGSTRGGVLVNLRNANDEPISGVTRVTAGTTALEKVSDFFFSELLTSGQQTFSYTEGTNNVTFTRDVVPGQTTVLTLKPGLLAAAALPAAGRVPTRTLAPGMFISIYGASMAASANAATSLPLPTTLSGTQALVGTAAMGLQFAGPTQINAILPEDASGVVTIAVRGTNGQQRFNAFIEPAVPAVFTQTGTGTGLASVIQAQSGVVVTANSPAKGGDVLSLYLTGLGATETRDGLQWARITPKLFVDNIEAQVLYAGRAPGFAGLDQINFIVPANVRVGTTVPMRVESNGRTSNAVTLPIL